jgi:alpha-amylase
LESPVEQWFKPLAYALILLREQGIPCVFYPALYGTTYNDKCATGEDVCVELKKVEQIEKIMLVRKLFACGQQRDYFDDPNLIGWTREGGDTSGCAVLLSNFHGGEKWMMIGERHAGKDLIDITGSIPEKVQLDENGQGLFKVNAGSLSIWVNEENCRLTDILKS